MVMCAGSNPALDHKQVHTLVYDIMNDKQRKDYEEHYEADFSFEVPKLSRFRVNAFNQHRGAAAVFRTVPSKVLTMDDLGMGKVFQDLAEKARGLVLVTARPAPVRVRHWRRWWTMSTKPVPNIF